MQRWIVITVVVAFLAALGAGFGLWTYRRNKPEKVWVPVGLNPDLPAEKREELAEQIKAKLLEGSIILDAVTDVNLASKIDLPTSEAAEADVRKRLFVEIGETKSPQGATVPSMNVGIRAQRKTFTAMGEVSMRLMKDVWKMLGVKDPSAEPAPF